MRNMNGCKLATAVLVFTLLLSCFVMIPGTTVKGASSTYSISFNVTDTDTDPIVNVQTVLQEVHTGSIDYEFTDSSGLASFNPGPGYFMLSLVKNGYFSVEYPDVIRFDDLSNVNLGIIEMEDIPDKAYTLSLKVYETGTTDFVEGLTTQLYDSTRGDLIYSDFGIGNQTIDVYSGTFKIVLSAPGFEKQAFTYTVSGSSSITREMDDSSVVRGFVYINGSPVMNGLTAYLVSKNIHKLPEERILEPRSTGTNTFVIDASNGDYWLVVDADGAISNVTDIAVNGSRSLTVNLTSETVENEAWNVAYTENWNSFNLTNEFTYNSDHTFSAINYSFLPSIRMQIDFAFGEGNGAVGPTEASLFMEAVARLGPWYVSTIDYLTINQTAYVSNASGISSLSMDGLRGSVTDKYTYEGTMLTSYTSISQINIGSPNYIGAVNITTGVKYPSDAPMDRTYSFVLPDGYVLVGNQTDEPDVAVMGYTTVSITPDIDMSWGTANVDLEIEASEAPSAVAAIETGKFAYAVIDNDTLLYYIVRENNSINFTAVGSFDPNGNPLKYQWTFGDGDVKTTTTIRYEKTYEQNAYELDAKLTVIDVAGLTDEATFKVRVDGLNPIPMIIVDGETIPAGGTVNTGQDQPLVFDGSGSVDWINSPSDPEQGIIVSWHWDFGDGNSTTVVLAENVTHAYEDAGTFNVTLNVTDSVGHFAMENITINVNDTTPPVVQFQVLNSDFVDISEEAPIENETLYFNASETFDNYYPQDELTFIWDFGDDTNGTGINVSHSYASIGTFTAKLTVTDPAGNQANETMDITVTSSPRPDLRITSITTNPSRFTEGQSGRIMVNVTNVGNDNATGVKATFYLLKTDGSKELLGESTDLTINGSSASLLVPDQSGIITWSWTPGSKGNFTIYIEVEALREINKQDNHDTISIDVQEAAWKAAAIYGGVFAVIVVIIVLFYMRKRLPWGASKAPAKTRKSKK
jgi:PKD repeat protein